MIYMSIQEKLNSKKTQNDKSLFEDNITIINIKAFKSNKKYQIHYTINIKRNSKTITKLCGNNVCTSNTPEHPASKVRHFYCN